MAATPIITVETCVQFLSIWETTTPCRPVASIVQVKVSHRLNTKLLVDLETSANDESLLQRTPALSGEPSAHVMTATASMVR